MKIKCEICLIKTSKHTNKKRTFMAKFPLDEERCKQWVAATGNEDLVYVPIEKLHQLKYVCGKHFRQKDFKKKKTQLRKNAVPCLEIAAKPLTEDVMLNFPLHIFKKEIKDHFLQDHNYCIPTGGEQRPSTSIGQRSEILNSIPCSPKPSTSTTKQDSKKLTKRSNSCSPTSPKPSTSTTKQDSKKLTKRSNSCSPTSPKPSTSTTKQDSKKLTKRSNSCSPTSPKPSTSTTKQDSEKLTKRKRSNSCSPTSPKPSTSTTKQDSEKLTKRKRSNSCSPTSPKPSVSSKQKQPLTPRKRILLKKLKGSRIQIKNLQKRVDEIENITSPVLKSLIESTIKNQKRLQKGKRWSRLNKTVALAIYKKSPKAYRYLSKLLPMPSVRTLQTVLQNMKMDPGIDPTILTHLRKKAESLSEKDKLCVILFDEIALKRRLIYNPSSDQIDGYEDLSDEGGRSAKIADHALVVMLQGLHKKIKQPIAYNYKLLK